MNIATLWTGVIITERIFSLPGVDLVKDRKTKEPAKEEVQKVCLQAWEKG